MLRTPASRGGGRPGEKRAADALQAARKSLRAPSGSDTHSAGLGGNSLIWFRGLHRLTMMATRRTQPSRSGHG